MPTNQVLATPIIPGRSLPFRAYTVDMFGDADIVHVNWDTSALSGLLLAAGMDSIDATSGYALMPAPGPILLTPDAAPAADTFTFTVVGLDRNMEAITSTWTYTGAGATTQSPVDFYRITSIQFTTDGAVYPVVQIGMPALAQFTVPNGAFCMNVYPEANDVKWSVEAVPAVFSANTVLVYRYYGRWFSGVAIIHEPCEPGTTFYLAGDAAAVAGDIVVVSFEK